MPLKIRCPHCRKILVADDDVAGQRKACPACGRHFDVPARLPDAPTPHAVGLRCPRCGTEAAPTATHCHRCHTDLRSGLRLPLGMRLRRLSWRVWVGVGVGTAVVATLAALGIQLHRIRSQPVRVPTVTEVATDVDGAALARALLAARDATARAAALEQMRGAELRVVPGLAAELARDCESPDQGLEACRSRRAAIDLLARFGDPRSPQRDTWLATLERCQTDPCLREAALHARAVLGDAAVLSDLAERWLALLERAMFLGRLSEATGAQRDPALGAQQRRARAELARCASGLRRLADDDANLVFERLADAYWASWCWLGQGRGERFAAELFDLAQPAGESLAFRPELVRTPRDTLVRVAERGTPAARAAAGVMLREQAPQYRSAASRIAAALVALLADADGADQQRLVWAVGRLRGQRFGPTSAEDPRELGPADMAGALRALRPDRLVVPHGAYPGPPVLVYRAATVQGQWRRELLARMCNGWPAARGALDEWLAGDLGWTPELEPLLAPGQRQPDYAALATVLVIAAATQTESVRPQLELWREATDQPAWVRALAYTVLGSFDARRGNWDSGWPARLDLGETGVLDSGTPGWDHFGRVLAAGGPAMQARFEEYQPAGVSEAARRRLLAAAQQAADQAAAGRP